ncbi:unnamed protein product [Adineta steineri]|uniref:Uncharacterized protein n=1 Tax=Adineta steineri TaxID=433720 RepID=A0A818ZTJ0_9BILA|nr:unnamed protein product [Adineta steineri]CAF3769615.1 unnamed protein product [Adineta steineri]
MIRIINWYKPRWRLLIVLLTPLVLLPIPLVRKSSQARCGYIVLILTIYWVFEAIPLALFSMAGILPTETVASHYFKYIIVNTFLWNNSAATSIMLPVALAITNELESHTKGYHEKKNGAKEATTVRTKKSCNIKATFSITIEKSDRLIITTSEDKKYNNIKKGFLLAVAYSATIGSLSRLLGTAPNIFVKGFTDRLL